MELSTAAFLIYLTTTFLCVIFLTFRAYQICEWKNTKTLLKAVYSMKSIYGAVLVQLYDTSTDVAILVLWGIRAYDEVSGQKDYENINMLSFLIPSIILIFMYRIAFAMVHYRTFHSYLLYCDHVYCDRVEPGFGYSRIDTVLILCDLYIFKLVYQQFIEQYLTPCLMQKKLQTLETVFESIPQLTLQSVFLIRTYNTALADNNNEIFIVFVSITASLLSTVSKFLRSDHEWVIEAASKSHFSCKRFPCVSFSYLAVIFWRISESIARFSIFTLLWAVVGGIYLPIYLLISIVVYHCLDRYTNCVWIINRDQKSGRTTWQLSSQIIYTLQCVVGLPLKCHLIMNIVRFVDHIIMLTILYLFAFFNFDCKRFLCYDSKLRNARENPFILILLLMAVIATFIGFIIYLGLYQTQTVNKTKNTTEVEIVGGTDKYDRFEVYRIIEHPVFYRDIKKVYAQRKNKTTNVTDNSEKEEVHVQLTDIPDKPDNIMHSHS